MATAGCGKYSLSSLKASKAFKDANAAVSGEGLQEGGRSIRGRRLESDGARPGARLQRCVLLPGELLRPALQAGQAGRPAERRLHPEGDPELPEGRRPHRRPEVEEGVARVSGRRLRTRQAERPRQGRAGLSEDDRPRAERPHQLHAARQAVRGRGALRRSRGAAAEGQGRQAERPDASTRPWPASTTSRGSSTRRSMRSRRPRTSRRTTPRAGTSSRRTTGTRRARTSA